MSRRLENYNWRGGVNDFELTKIGQIRALQKLCKAGPAFVLTRLQTGTWEIDDILAPLVLGLEGGGMDGREARDLVNDILEKNALQHFVIDAAAIVAMCVYGDEAEDGDPVGEWEDDEPTSENLSPTDNLGSPISTAPEPSSD